MSGATYTCDAFVESLQGAREGEQGLTDERSHTGLRRVEHVMGMPVIVDVRDDDVDEDVIEDVFGWLRLVDERFSPFKPDSEICRIDRGELSRESAHPDVRAVLAHCDRLCAETGGYFDARAGAGGCLIRPVSSRDGPSTEQRQFWIPQMR